MNFLDVNSFFIRGKLLSCVGTVFSCATSLPVMLADASAPGDNRDVHQGEVPEATQLCPARDGDVEGGPQLDGPAHAGRGGRLVGGVNGVGDILGPFDLGTEEVKKLFCLSIDAPGKLDLLHHLVCTVIQFLLGGDNAEQIQDECQQEHCYEDEHHRTEIVDITILTFQYGCRVLAGPAILGDALPDALDIVLGIAFGKVKPPPF